jgi:hypothetical protein
VEVLCVEVGAYVVESSVISVMGLMAKGY